MLGALHLVSHDDKAKACLQTGFYHSPTSKNLETKERNEVSRKHVFGSRPGFIYVNFQLKNKSLDHEHFWRFPLNFTDVLIWLTREGCWKDAVCFCTHLSKFLILESAKAEGWKGNEKLDSIWDVSSLWQHFQEQKYLAASEKWKVTSSEKWKVTSSSSSISEEDTKRRQLLIYC